MNTRLIIEFQKMFVLLNLPIQARHLRDVTVSVCSTVEQSPVLGDLQLQSGLDVEQDCVLVALVLKASAESAKLPLQAAHLHLEAGQHASIAGLCLSQSGFHGRFLRHKQRKTSQIVSY